MSLRLKLLLTSTASILTIIGLVACAGYSAQAFEKTLQDLALNTSALRNHTNADMMHDALRSDVYAAFYAAREAVERKDQILADTQRHAAEFSALIAQNRALKLSDESKAALQAVEAPLSAYIDMARNLALQTFDDPSSARLALPAFDDSFQALEVAMEEAGDRLESSAKAATERANALSDITKRAALFGLIIGLVVGALTIWTVLRNVLSPLKRITSVMQRLAGGDLDIDLPVSRSDEIGLMAKALHKFRDAEAEKRALETQARAERDHADKTRLMLESERAEREQKDIEFWKREDAARESREAEKARDAQVVQSTIEILASNLKRLAQGDLECTIERPFTPSFEPIRADFNTAIHKLGSTVEAIKNIAQVINDQTMQMESASDELAQRTEQQAASLEQSSAATTELSNAVNTTAEGSIQTKDVISAAKAASASGFTVVKQTTSAMTSIRESSQQITQIIGVVDEIAFQTNLLALNAGVEAARAGDAGRGFAVVATEVRALAQRSADAAKEIKDLISRSSHEVEAGFQLVAQTGTAIEQIMNQVSQIDRGIANISARSLEQAATLKQVNTAISEIDQSTQRNAVMAEHSTAACRTLAEQTAQLHAMLSNFKVGSARRSFLQSSGDEPIAARRPRPAVGA